MQFLIVSEFEIRGLIGNFALAKITAYGCQSLILK